MNILITGAAGFIGSHVADLLIEKGHVVMGLDNFSSGRMENFPAARCDILKLDDMHEYFMDFRPEVVIHLAAQPAISSSWNNPSWDAAVNIMGTLNVLKEARFYQEVKRFIFASTSAVYAPTDEILTEKSQLGPESPYGVSKLAAEGYVRNLFPNRHVILRFANVYGPRQIPLGENQVIPRMIKHLLKGDDFCIHGNGMQKRDFVFVKDVARAVECAMDGKVGTYNVSTGIATSINMLAAMMEHISNSGKHHWQHTEENDPRQMVRISPHAYAHAHNAMGGMGWVPRMDLMQGLQETWDWWKSKS